MIQEIKVYEVDGMRFDTMKEATRYEGICLNVALVMAGLDPTTEEVKEMRGYQKHDIVTLRRAFADFCSLCAIYIPMHGDTFEKTSRGVLRKSIMSKILLEYKQDYPILYSTFFRFMCINFDTGFEFQQPYYATHLAEAFKEIENNTKIK